MAPSWQQCVLRMNERRRAHIPHLKQELAWCVAAETFEIMNHMHLVLVSNSMRDLQPCARPVRQLRMSAAWNRETRENTFGDMPTSVLKRRSIWRTVKSPGMQCRDIQLPVAPEDMSHSYTDLIDLAGGRESLQSVLFWISY
jgi:hypothetical protein